MNSWKFFFTIWILNYASDQKSGNRFQVKSPSDLQFRSITFEMDMHGPFLESNLNSIHPRIFMPKSVYPGQYIFTVLLLSFFQNGHDPLFEQIGISFTQEYLNYAKINLWFWRKKILTASHFSYYPFRKGHDPLCEQMLVPFTQWYFAIKLKAPVVLDNFLPLFCNYLPLKKDMTFSSLRGKKTWFGCFVN